MNIRQLGRKIRDLIISVSISILGIIFIVWPIGDLIDSIQMRSWHEKEYLIDSFWFEPLQKGTDASATESEIPLSP